MCSQQGKSSLQLSARAMELPGKLRECCSTCTLRAKKCRVHLLHAVNIKPVAADQTPYKHHSSDMHVKLHAPRHMGGICMWKLYEGGYFSAAQRAHGQHFSSTAAAHRSCTAAVHHKVVILRCYLALLRAISSPRGGNSFFCNLVLCAPALAKSYEMLTTAPACLRVLMGWPQS